MSRISERHRRYAGTFADVVARTTDWDAPTPVPEWRAHDVVEHLLTWPGQVLREWAGIELTPRDEGDFTARWAAWSRDMQALLESEESTRLLEKGDFQGQPLETVIDVLYLPDVFMHTWDLAKAGGLEAGYDQESASAMLAGMRSVEDMLRTSGHFGPAMPTQREDPMSQLMAFVGRDTEFTAG